MQPVPIFSVPPNIRTSTDLIDYVYARLTTSGDSYDQRPLKISILTFSQQVMALRLLWQTCRRSASKSIDSPRRLSSHGPRSSGTRFSVYPHLRQAGLISSGLLAATLLYAHTQTPLLADTDDGQKNQRKGTPLSSLVRSYVVYTACSVPALVDWSPQILSTLLSIPILGHATEFVVRKTFFDQVCILLDPINPQKLITNSSL